MALRSTAFVAVGANLNPEENIEAALLALMRQTEVVASSTFYWTEPIGRPEQPKYLNGVWKISTTLEPRELKLDVLRRIEDDLGRIRQQDRFASRTIDLDLIIYADLVMDDPDLNLPDPDIRERAFIAAGLLELDPELVLPDTKERLSDLPAASKTADLGENDSFSRKLKGHLKK